MTSRPQPANSHVHIFIDLDGVIADFDAHAKAEGKYDAEGRVKWGELNYAWWTTMPICEGGKAFYDAACKLGVTKFLTGPVLSEECFSGKAHWIQNFAPERGKFILQDFIVCPSGDKYYLAGANRILVDDRENNIKEWVAAGGIGIHHTGNFAETMVKLQTALASLAPAPVAPVITASSPMLVTVAGMSGSGKSTLAAALSKQVPNAVHLDSDVMRKEMFGVSSTTRLPAEAYSAEASQKLAQVMGDRVRQHIAEGKNVVVSSTLLSQATRGMQEKLAADCGARFVGIHLEADLQTLFERVAQRQGDASDAGVDIVRMQAAGNIAKGGNWSTVDASQKPEDVLQAALKVIADVRGGKPGGGNVGAAPKPAEPKP